MSKVNIARLTKEKHVAQAKIYLQQLVQDSQEYGSNDEHMVSRVFFDLEVNGTRHNGLYADIKQTVGSSFETSPLEVSNPFGYKGAFNNGAFSSIVEQYYRSLVGAQGRGIQIQGGSNIRMRNNRFIQPGEAVFEVNATGGPW